MAKIYARWIEQGKITIDDVPLTWRAAVQILLDADTEAVVTA